MRFTLMQLGDDFCPMRPFQVSCVVTSVITDV
jgi:hypothetical protein